MPWNPTVSPLAVQVAVRVFPLPERVLAEHPLIVFPLFLKATVPVGAAPVTLAVNVTLGP